jgi:hypothetical protein
MKRPSRLPYLRHNLANFNRGDAGPGPRRTWKLACVCLIVWTGVIRWLALQECEYRHQRDAAMKPSLGSSDGIPTIPRPIVRNDDGIPAGVEVTETRGSISFTF